MPRSQMAYDASVTPLRRIFPQSLAMIVQFYGAGKATAAIIAAAAATADSLARSFFEIAGIAGLGVER